jgi:MFS family permease
LGFAEGSVQPAFIIITSHWYKRREHPIRVATWVSMSGVSQILGVLIMYAIGSRDMAIASWRVLFFVIGGMTCVCGIGFILLMPRNPAAHGSSTSARANSLPSASPSIVLPETGPNSTMLS